MVVKDLWFTHQTKPIRLNELWPRLWPCILNVQNYFATVRPHLWSLAFEEHFYHTLPLVLTLYVSSRKIFGKRIPLMVLCCLLVSVGWRIASIDDFDPDLKHLFYTHLRIDALSFGFLLSYVFYVRPKLWEILTERRTILLFAGLLAISPALLLPLEDRLLRTVGLTLLYLGYGSILIACVSESRRRHWLDHLLEGSIGRLLAFIGFSSYSIYLWHMEIGNAAVVLFHRYISIGNPSIQWLASTFTFLIASITGGFLIGKAVEMPVLKFRDHIFPARSASSHL